MSGKLPISTDAAKQFVELLPELGWNFTAAYARVTGMKPGDAGTRKAAAHFLSRADVARMIRTRWQVAPDSKLTQEEAQGLLRALVYADPGNYLTVDRFGRGRYLSVQEFKDLPQSLRLVVEEFEVRSIRQDPDDPESADMEVVVVKLPKRVDALKVLAAIGGLLGGEKEREGAAAAAELLGRFAGAYARARDRVIEAGKTQTAKQLQLPGGTE